MFASYLPDSSGSMTQDKFYEIHRFDTSDMFGQPSTKPIVTITDDAGHPRDFYAEVFSKIMERLPSTADQMIIITDGEPVKVVDIRPSLLGLA